MDEEELSEDQKTLESFLNPAAAKAEEEEAAGEEEEESEEGKEEKGKPKKPVEAAKGRSFTAGLRARVGKLPTPGSIAFPLLGVLILILFVVPVGGKTRAVHLWNVLIGKEALPNETLGGFNNSSPAQGSGKGDYQDNVIQFQPTATRFQMIEEGSI